MRKSDEAVAPLIELSGAWITVLGAVYTKKVIVQHLTGPIYLSPQLHHPQSTFDVPLRLFYALRMALHDLSAYYGKLSHSTKVSPFFPFVTLYPVSDGTERSFKYRKALSNDDSKAIYKAIDADGRRIIVKFASTYNARAHRLLASHDLAPELLYDGTDGAKYGGLIMIVMRYVDGTTLNEWLEARMGPLRFDGQLGRILELTTQANNTLTRCRSGVW